MTVPLSLAANPGPASLRTPDRLVRLLGLLAGLFVLAVTVWRLDAGRDFVLRDSRTGTENLARSLADHANAKLQTADILLAGLVERVETDGTGPVAAARLHAVLMARLAPLSGVAALSVLGPDGGRLVDSRPSTAPADKSDHEYFTYHRDNPDRGSHIGPPVRSRTTGRWAICVSRRIDHADGSFAGVALATIDFQTFTDFYASFALGRRGSIVLDRDDGTMLVRVPALGDGARDGVGASVAHNWFFREYRRLGASGTAVGVSGLDGVSRLVSFRKVDGFALVVFVARARTDILAAWRGEAWTALALALPVSCLLAWLGWRLANQMGAAQRAALAIQCSERQHRLLAENSTDLIVQLGPDRRFVYASPASQALLGYPPQELTGRHPYEIAHPEDRPALAAYFALVAGCGSAAPITLRARRKDGAELWAETSFRTLGNGQGMVAVMRDVTRRKEAEFALHEANNRLQRAAMLDGLTGIANRRCFDATLRKETRRAARNKTQLSLILFDVDHFKAFNDTHGHLAGDACLRAIATAATLAVKRPADLVARYGGEEFAVLLPETDTPGAMEIAEQIRRAVGLLAVPGDGAVAISAGVACLTPSAGTDATQALVAPADRGLYDAKRLGRNRVCLAPAMDAVRELVAD